MQKFLLAQEKVGKKQNGLSYETVDSEIGLHRSPKCSSMIFLCLLCIFTTPPTWVCQNMTYCAFCSQKYVKPWFWKVSFFFEKNQKLCKKSKNSKIFFFIKAPESSQGVLFLQTFGVGQQLWCELSISRKIMQKFFWRKKKWEILLVFEMKKKIFWNFCFFFKKKWKISKSRFDVFFDYRRRNTSDFDKPM